MIFRTNSPFIQKERKRKKTSTFTPTLKRETSRSKTRVKKKRKWRGENEEEQEENEEGEMRRRNEEAAEGDACGFSEGGVGLPMKYWYHFVYNIVEGARKSVGQKVGLVVQFHRVGTHVVPAQR